MTARSASEWVIFSVCSPLLALRARLGASALLLLLLPLVASAQPERYELGRRLREFEKIWEENNGAVTRNDALVSLNKAVQSFFALKLGEAGRALDDAGSSLQIAHERPSLPRWARSLYLKLDRRLVDRDDPKLNALLDRFYKVEGSIPDGLMLRVTNRNSPESNQVHEFANVTQLPLEAPLDLGQLTQDQDLPLHYTLLVGERPLVSGELGVSVVRDLEKRLAALRKLDETLPVEGPARTTDRLTLRHLTQLLTTLAKPGTPETDYPAARLLAEAEALAKTLQSGQPYYGKSRNGQFWLMLPTGQARTVARVQIPALAAKGEPMPLVIALHGAGGSENMFFDTYGAGKIAKLAMQRGWLLVAPRSSGFSVKLGDLIDELAKVYPVEKSKVFVVGHSMGAGQAMAAAQLQPERLAAVAALGGGRGVRVSEPMKKLPFFVGVGTKDFAYPGAKGLADSLKKGGVASVDYREYPDLEHLIIVQHALPEVFEFFAKSAGLPGMKPQPKVDDPSE